MSEFFDIEWVGYDGAIRNLRKCRQELHNGLEIAVKRASLRLEKEIKIVITEYAQSHPVVRYRKGRIKTFTHKGVKYNEINTKTGKEKREPREKLMGSALIDTGFYRMNWTTFIERQADIVFGHTATNTEYARWLENGTQYIRGYRIVQTAWARCRGEVHEIMRESVSQVI